MQEELEYNYDDFEIIRLDPNVDYVDSDDSEMECEDSVTCSEIKNISIEKSADLNFLEDKLNCENNNQHGETEMTVEMSAIRNDEEEDFKENIMDIVESKPRKKLNLEEYKIRRANKPAPTIVLESKNVLELCTCDTLPPIVLPTDPRSIKNLMNNQQSIITQDESKENNQELKDSLEEDVTQKIHPHYEEIVFVSIACNTDITISPQEVDEDCEKSSTNLLTNIVNSFQQNVSSAKTILNSSTSLLSSINAVLSEKRTNSPNDLETKSQIDEHGEDKIIMHLRKDRVRQFRSNCEVQTEVTPLFPPLILSPSLIFHRIKNARNFRRRSTRSRSRSSISPEAEYFHRRGNYKYSRSVNSSSMNSSDSSNESDTSAYSSCRSSDSIKRYDNRYKPGYQRPNFTYQEERKIIYIGGLLEETTKDELRRKFLKYGTIKKISIHVKEDGSLRYGFVTFAEANAAYDILDAFKEDPALCNFDLRFGGRRKFCRQTYADLDSCNLENEDIYNNNSKSSSNDVKVKPTELSFEDLLNMTKRKLCKN